MSKCNVISTVITKKLSASVGANMNHVHITVERSDDSMSSNVHYCLDVAKFSVYNTTDTDEFFKHLQENGFQYHEYSDDLKKKIHDAYNSVLDDFR